ncbi:hypothetical protein, partial [Thermocatellispora tengchongensis]|uniref:hypothetical protein n=1 Tax=Thermocatellispora tengchongensis TaxID=1073253 RepID=UPI0031E68E0C
MATIITATTVRGDQYPADAFHVTPATIALLEAHGWKAPKPKAAPAPASCIADECDGKQSVRGYCRKHYQRLLKHGDPNTVMKTGRTAKPKQEQEPGAPELPTPA